MLCRRYSGMGGMALPQLGGPLDQDAELMMALDLATHLYDEMEEGKRNAEEKIKAKQAELEQALLPH